MVDKLTNNGHFPARSRLALFGNVTGFRPVTSLVTMVATYGYWLLV